MLTWEREVRNISRMYVEDDHTIRSLAGVIGMCKSSVYKRLLACEEVDPTYWEKVNARLKSNQVEGRKRGGAAWARKRWAKRDWPLNVK